MQRRSIAAVLGVLISLGLLAILARPSEPDPERVRRTVEQYLATPQESLSPNLEHSVMAFRGRAAEAAFRLLDDPRRRGPAANFLSMCATTANLPLPTDVETIWNAARSRPSRLQATAAMGVYYTEDEWQRIGQAWRTWWQHNAAAMLAMDRPCDPRYEL